MNTFEHGCSRTLTNIREIALLFDVPILPNSQESSLNDKGLIMHGWFLTIASLFCLATYCMSGQSERRYVQAEVGYVSAGGRFTDSAGFASSAVYSIGYQWAPSRTASFGMLGCYMPATVASGSPATVFGMAAVVHYRLFKHGFTPYAGAEVGFRFVSIDDSLASNSAMKPNLSYAFTARAGFLLPVSEKVEVDMAAHYTHTGIGGGLTLPGGALGLRYRLQ
jgi:hypothetical protein